MSVEVSRRTVPGHRACRAFRRMNTAGPDWDSRYDVSPDGKRFLWRCPVQSNTQTQINVVLNLFDELKRLPLSKN